MKIKPTRNNIEFDFLENTINGGFSNKTDWGFEIKNRTEDVKIPRWGVVRQTGDEVKNIQIGDYILIQPMMWTEKLTLDGEQFRFTNEDKVLLKSKEKPVGIN